MVVLGAITVDCHEVLPEARFWAELTGRQVNDGATDDFAQVPAGDGGLPLMFFVKVDDEHVEKNALHLDLMTEDDLQATVARAVELGATKVADFPQEGFSWTTLRDPAGHLFDIAKEG